MGYAAIYRQNRKPWKRVFKFAAYFFIFGVLLYFSLELLGAQSGLMVGGTMPGQDSSTSPRK